MRGAVTGRVACAPLAFLVRAGGIGAEGRAAGDVVPMPSATFAPEDTTASAIDAAPTSLRPAMAALGMKAPRLVSRFIELALLGAHRCLHPPGGAAGAQATLPAHARVYLATGLGDVARTDELYYAVMPPRGEMASPAQFVTSGNNMAAFFVAQRAGLLSRNLTISAGDLSLERALCLAADDLAHGATRDALVGAVDETTAPREFHARRYRPTRNAPIGEGSTWFWLAARRAPGSVGELLDAGVLPARPHEDADAWARRLAAALRPGAATDVVWTGGRLDDAHGAALRRAFGHAMVREYVGRTGRFPTAAGLVLAGSLRPGADAPAGLRCLHVNRDDAGHTGWLAWRVGCEPA